MKKLKILLLSMIIFIPYQVLAYSDYIIPGGANIGIKVNSKGILVVGFYKINGKYNKSSLEIGDYITKVNGNEINTIDELISEIDKTNTDGKVNLTIRRKDEEKIIEFSLVKSGDVYKTGLYVKDSITGIGTLTYIDPSTKIYGALGHEIIDSSSEKKLEIKDGKIFKSDVSSIDRSSNGNPGTKNAKFYPKEEFGDVSKNTIHGIYGNFKSEFDDTLMEVGKKDDLKLGSALIRTVLNDNTIKEYEINITKIDKKSNIKNIYFEITDEKLLNECGGIVQGMSGSPIIQNNKIYGAVTHVVIENVKKGYGVFITTMLEEGEK